MDEKKKEAIKSILTICRKNGVTLEEVLIAALGNNTTEEKQCDDCLEKRIANILKELGIPASILGYRYIISSILFIMEHSEERLPLVKVIYPEIAKKHGTKPGRVERAIRHAIEVSCSRGAQSLIEEIFGYTISTAKGKPTNSEFIYAMVEFLKEN